MDGWLSGWQLGSGEEKSGLETGGRGTVDWCWSVDRASGIEWAERIGRAKVRVGGSIVAAVSKAVRSGRQRVGDRMARQRRESKVY